MTEVDQTRIQPDVRLTIDVWSDVVCPWCYVGVRNLELALAEFENADQVDITLRSFQLDPGAPSRDDTPLVTRLARKYGTSEDQIRAGQQRLTDAGVPLGIDFRFDLTARGNTLDAHRLLHLAADRGLQVALKHRLFEGYFTKGEAVGEHDALRQAAIEAGLDPAEVDDVLSSDRYMDEVALDIDAARDLGVTGVPFFLVDGRLGIPGAQPPELLLRVLRRAWKDVVDAAEEAALTAGFDSSTACGPDGCELY